MYIEEQNLRDMLSNPLTDGFKVTDYLKPNLSNEKLADLLSVYEEWRGATEYEDIYRLKDKDDCILLIGKYGVDKVLTYINAGYEYAFDGLNFADMVAIKSRDLIDAIVRLCDIDFIAGMIGNGCGQYLEEFFDMKSLVNAYKRIGSDIKENEKIMAKRSYYIDVEYLDGTKETRICHEFSNAIENMKRLLRDWENYSDIQELTIRLK